MRHILACSMLLAIFALAIAKSLQSTKYSSIIQLPEKADTPKRGQHLYENKCGSCHFLYKPAKYTKCEWDLHLLKMAKKSKLTAEEEKLVRDYLITYAKDN